MMEYFGLFVAAFLAGTPFPMNSEVVLSGMLVMGFPLLPCIVVATVGNWLGAIANYFLGRLCSYEKMIKWTRANPQKLEKVKTYLSGKGLWLAVCSGLPIVGNLVIISYGILRTPFWRVSGIMLIGQIVRFTLWSVFTVGLSGLF